MTTVDEGREYWPTAIAHANAGASAWRSAVHAQLGSAASHSDFYLFGADLVETLRAVDGLLSVLERQVGRYAEGRDLYDDAGSDPVVRIQEATEHLRIMRARLAEAERAGNAFWSAVGHIGERS